MTVGALPAAAVDRVLDARLGCATTRFRLRVYAAAASGVPVIILEEVPENAGPPVPEVVFELAAWVRGRFLPDEVGEPVWIEAWLGRALSALVRGRLPFSTYMRVDLGPTPPTRVPISRPEVHALVDSTASTASDGGGSR